jgi:hypothetical protein
VGLDWSATVTQGGCSIVSLSPNDVPMIKEMPQLFYPVYKHFSPDELGDDCHARLQWPH